MSLNNEKCVVCNAYLFPEDDVVYCPECGAPHHRDCYNFVGKCGLQEYHGTQQQYKKPDLTNNEPKTQDVVDNQYIVCGMCGEKYDADEMSCPKCNTPNMLKAGGRFVKFDFLGGVPSDVDLGDGVTADEAKKFVINNTHRYIPKFLNFKNGKKASWNWLAFLTPCGWLMSRKMYLLGAIIGALQIAFVMFTAPFTAAVSMLDTSDARNYMEISSLILENIETIGIVAIATAFIGSFLELLLRIIIATLGDFIYRNRVISKVQEIKRAGGDDVTAFRKKGGVSFFAAILGYFAVSYLPNVIAYMLGIL